MINEPELTMVLCAYKESPFLEEAILSLKKQRVPVKIILATSTPGDFLKDLTERYGIEYFINPVKGGGIASDWEFAVSCVKTKYATIAHQDDIYFPEYAEKVLKKLKQEPESLIVFTNYCDRVGNENLINRGYLKIKRLLLWAYYFKSSWKLRLFKLLPLCFGNAICCPAVTYNLEKTGPLRFDRSFSVNLDWAEWLAFAGMKGAFSYIKEVCMAHRIDETTETSAAIGDNRRYNEDLRIFTSLWGKIIANLLIKFYSKSYKMATVKKK